ncbi:hypothetical protein [Nocardia huaxiensis]|uniref:hypothetical protein n=1 Tax=Nocardia huaxiensis TaxID=2755382 RepID=UPI001E385EEF|nr:hypothetical protein [Nocardia huaxiensis]UFS94323.1 hypothetical protein LPY97_26640 [Nocardia huaxiensis]
MSDELRGWIFHFDEDGFVIAENEGYSQEILFALSDFFDDMHDLDTVQIMMGDWKGIKAAYPENPVGLAFNATHVYLSDVDTVTVASLYEQFDAVTLPEIEFMQAVTDFRDFLQT